MSEKRKLWALRMPESLLLILGAEAKRRGISMAALAIERMSNPWGGERTPLASSQAVSKPLEIPDMGTGATKEETLSILRAMITQGGMPTAEQSDLKSDGCGFESRSPYLDICGVDANGKQLRPGCYNPIFDKARWIRRDGKDKKGGNSGRAPLCEECEMMG